MTTAAGTAVAVLAVGVYAGATAPDRPGVPSPAATTTSTTPSPDQTAAASTPTTPTPDPANQGLGPPIDQR